MEKAHDALTETLDGEFLLISFEDQGDGFRVWTGEGEGLTVIKAEAAAREFLKRMVEVESQRDDSCVACPSCQDRLARVTAALAALGDPECWKVTANPKTMENLH